MKRKLKALVLTLAVALPFPALADGTPAKLYKNPNCGCCDEYAKYLKANGFDVTVIPTHNLTQMQVQNRVPAQLAGCHTTVVGDYLFEGHIPVDAVKRVLEEKPFIRGLAVPGMPAGSPGMTGAKKGPLHVYYIYISEAEPPKVYATY